MIYFVLVTLRKNYEKNAFLVQSSDTRLLPTRRNEKGTNEISAQPSSFRMHVGKDPGTHICCAKKNFVDAHRVQNRAVAAIA